MRCFFMTKKNFYIKFLGFMLLFVGLFISIIITTKIYYFINPYNNNKIFSYNMLIAIKNYQVSYLDLFKNKVTIRIIELIILVLLLVSKHGNKIYSLTCLLSGAVCGFYGTIFYLEMGYKGIINLIIISFPHMIFYIAAFLCLVSMSIMKDKTIITTNETTKLFTKAAPYINILLLWAIGFLSETVINLFLVQKCFIIN